MKKRTYTLPVIITIAMVACVVFLITVFLQSPYEKAIRNGDKAMENYNYTRAVSEYTIAQNVDSDRLEAYEKGLNALVLLNSNTVARDFLSMVNSCVEFCGTNSISDAKIVDAIDILVTLGNTKAACDILEHLHQSYSDSELIKEKIKTLNLEIYQDAPFSAGNETTPASTPIPQAQPEASEQLTGQTTTETQMSASETQAKNTNADTSEDNESSVAASPSPSPTPSSAPAQAATSAPSATPAQIAEPPSSSIEVQPGQSPE